MVLLFTLSCFAQSKKIDSLRSVLQNTGSDTSKVKLLNALCWELKSSDPEKALEYGQSALSLGKKTGYDKGIGNSLNFIGVVYHIKSNYTEALNYYMQSLEVQKEIGYKKGIAYTYNNIGSLYYDQTEYHKALQFYLKSLTIQEEIKNIKGIVSASTNVGLIYYEQKKYNTALEYFTKSLQFAEEAHDSSVASSIMTNIGLIYYDMGNTDKALNCYTRALKYAQATGAKNVEAALLNNIGDVYKKLLQFPLALEYYEKTLNTNREIGDKKGIASAYLSLGDMYRSMNDFVKAHACFDSCLYTAEQIGDKERVKESYKYKAEIYELAGNYTDAFECYRKFHLVNDSIYNEESNKNLLELQTKYETEKKEKEIQLLTRESELQKLVLKNNRILMYSSLTGLLLVLIIVVVIYRSYRTKQRTLKKETELSNLKSQFVNTVTHEFRTPIAAIMSSSRLLNEYYETWSKDERSEFFRQIGDSVDQMKLMLEKASVIGKDQSGKMLFNPKLLHLETFCKHIKDETQALFEEIPDINMEFRSEIGTVLADKELLRHIIGNLLSNAVKYSPGIEPVGFIIDLANGNICFTISDHGIGIPEEDMKHLFEMFHRCSNAEEIKGTGLGLSIVKRSVDLHKGEIKITSELGKGTSVSVLIPLQR